MFASTSSQPLVDADRSQPPEDLLKGRKRHLMRFLPKAIQTPGGRKGGPPLRIGKDARCSGIGAAPELCCQVRPVLDNDELYQRRGVEVEDQARCSETRSETEPAPFT